MVDDVKKANCLILGLFSQTVNWRILIVCKNVFTLEKQKKEKNKWKAKVDSRLSQP